MIVFEMLLLLSITTCLFWKTAIAEPDSCTDIDGNSVSPGRVYYDGDTWRTCRETGSLDRAQTMELMNEKWQSMFKMLDVNRNGVITDDDTVTFKNRFIAVYAHYGPEADAMKKTLGNFLNCLTLNTHGSQSEISEEEFVASYRKVFKTQKASGIEKIIRCNEYLLNIIDVNNDGFLSFMEMFQNFNAWKQGNVRLVMDISKMMGLNDKNLVSHENFDKFYAEVAYGENKEHYEEFKKIYKNMPQVFLYKKK